MAMEKDGETEELVPREPSLEDLASLCRELNNRGAAYLVIGGFAIRSAGYSRTTGDVDLLIDTGVENEAKVFEALCTLPDGCARELKPGEVEAYTVVRVADEILVDLMASACGIRYAEASRSIIVREIGGVAIPFASPELLWRMKKPTRREKDIPDLIFLRHWFEERGLAPPD